MRIEDSHASICRHTNPTATIAIRNQSLQPQGPPYPRLFFKTTSHCNTILTSKRCAHSRPVDGIPLQVFQPTLSEQNPNCEPHRDSSCQTQINNSRLVFSCMRFVLTKGHLAASILCRCRHFIKSAQQWRLWLAYLSWHWETCRDVNRPCIV